MHPSVLERIQKYGPKVPGLSSFVNTFSMQLAAPLDAIHNERDHLVEGHDEPPVFPQSPPQSG
jgi:hypothetical protein